MAANKHAGKKSLAQNDFLAPGAPTIGAATNVGTNRSFNDGAATVAFTPNALGAAATSYTATSSPGGLVATGSASPLTVSGLQSGVAYTFTVTGTNASGTSPASAASSSVTATTVPATMSAPTATAGVDQDTVSWTVPNTGGSAITTYRWTSSDGKTGTTTGTSVVVAQEGSTSQTYQVRAENANGVGVYSPSSNSVTTTPPFFPPFFPPYFPFFPPYFPPYFPYFPFFPPYFPPYFPYFPSFGPYFPPYFPFFPPFFPVFRGGTFMG